MNDNNMIFERNKDFEHHHANTVYVVCKIYIKMKLRTSIDEEVEYMLRTP